LTEDERARLNAALLERKHRWEAHARPKQLPPPGQWTTWLILAGRGFGKTRTGAEWVRDKAQQYPGCRIALVAEDAGDARDVMVEGESGLLRICHPRERPVYPSSVRRVSWANGSRATLYSAADYEVLRGPQHHFAWYDELAKYAHDREAWDNGMMGLRLGSNPQCVVTTTPKPTKLIKELLSMPGVVVTRGTTYENLENLSPAFRSIIAKYEGTQLGRQELEAEILDDVEGALWRRDFIEPNRVKAAPVLKRIVVAIDPSTTANETSDEAGIVAAGKGHDNEYYVLADKSLRALPARWANAALTLYHDLEADNIIAESNNGGEMIRTVIKSVARDGGDSIPIRLIHASRGKQTRAEPISQLYERNKVHHVGAFPAMEDELCSWVPGESASPNRLDALVWAITALMKGGGHA
jgi:phage terminase large subunit-like protein